MKKLISLVILILFSVYLHAQIEKGKLLIGMSTTLSSIGTGPEMFGVGYSSSKTIVGDSESEPSKKFGINLVPRVGYFFRNNFAAGIDLNFSFNSNEIKSTGQAQSSTYGGIGLFGRYYVPLTSVYPFVQADTGAGLGSVHIKSEHASNSDYDSFFYHFGGGIGISVPLGEVVLLDLIVDYDYIKEKSDRLYYGERIAAIQHSFGFEMGIMVQLGKKQ